MIMPELYDREGYRESPEGERIDENTKNLRDRTGEKEEGNEEIMPDKDQNHDEVTRSR